MPAYVPTGSCQTATVPACARVWELYHATVLMRMPIWVNSTESVPKVSKKVEKRTVARGVHRMAWFWSIYTPSGARKCNTSTHSSNIACSTASLSPQLPTSSIQDAGAISPIPIRQHLLVRSLSRCGVLQPSVQYCCSSGRRIL